MPVKAFSLKKTKRPLPFFGKGLANNNYAANKAERYASP